MKRGIKACCAIALLGLLIYGMDWGEILPRVGRISSWGLAAAFLAMVWELVVSSLRWSVALRMHELHFGAAYLFRSLANGYFFNSFLPSAIGGDAYRVYRTLPAEGYRSRALSAVIVERLTGFGTLLALGAVAALHLYAHQEIARAYFWTFTGAALAALATLYAVHHGWFEILASRIRHTAAFDALSHNWQHLSRARAAWVPLLGWSLVFQATSILILYGLFVISGHPVPLAYCALMSAASGVAALLPLSINGIGLMEGSLVAMAVVLGIDYDTATLVAIIRRLLMFALSLLCGLSYLLEGEPAPLRSAYRAPGR